MIDTLHTYLIVIYLAGLLPSLYIAYADIRDTPTTSAERAQALIDAFCWPLAYVFYTLRDAYDTYRDR